MPSWATPHLGRAVGSRPAGPCRCRLWRALLRAIGQRAAPRELARPSPSLGIAWASLADCRPVRHSGLPVPAVAVLCAHCWNELGKRAAPDSWLPSRRSVGTAGPAGLPAWESLNCGLWADPATVGAARCSANRRRRASVDCLAATVGLVYDHATCELWAGASYSSARPCKPTMNDSTCAVSVAACSADRQSEPHG